MTKNYKYHEAREHLSVTCPDCGISVSSELSGNSRGNLYGHISLYDYDNMRSISDEFFRKDCRVSNLLNQIEILLSMLKKDNHDNKELLEAKIATKVNDILDIFRWVHQITGTDNVSVVSNLSNKMNY